MAPRPDDELIDVAGDHQRDRPSDRDDDRGREAESPGEIPASGWKDVGLRVKDELKADQVPLLSAGVAFFFLLALFPALAATISVYGLVADPAQVTDQVGNLTEALPASASELITEQMEGIAEGGGGVGFAFVAGLLAALWAASSGMKHLVASINAAYGEVETRKFLKLRGLALALTVGAIVFGAVAVGVLAVLPVAVGSIDIGGFGQILVQIGSLALLAVAFAAGLAILYRYTPDRDQPEWSWVTTGAVIATVVWIIASVGFSIYVSNFASYGETYGAIGAIIVLMLWLSITAFAIILGAEVNSELEAQTIRDSTVGESEPIGQRDAVKADEVGDAEARD